MLSEKQTEGVGEERDNFGLEEEVEIGLRAERYAEFEPEDEFGNGFEKIPRKGPKVKAGRGRTL